MKSHFVKLWVLRIGPATALHGMACNDGVDAESEAFTFTAELPCTYSFGTSDSD